MCLSQCSCVIPPVDLSPFPSSAHLANTERRDSRSRGEGGEGAN
jgi:hypothetical protein